MLYQTTLTLTLILTLVCSTVSPIVRRVIKCNRSSGGDDWWLRLPCHWIIPTFSP